MHANADGPLALPPLPPLDLPPLDVAALLTQLGILPIDYAALLAWVEAGAGAEEAS
jgi:hypothetical protein